MTIMSDSKSEVVYRYIISYKIEHDGNSPSVRLIAKDCHISSTSLVAHYLDKLISKGMIEISNDTESHKIMVKGGSWRMDEELLEYPRKNEYQCSKSKTKKGECQ
jgi:SOS-response transcriptional repressor LexA